LYSDPSAVSTYKLPLSSNSQVLQKEKFTMSQAGPVASRQNAPHPHAIFKDPTGKFLIAPDLGADLIRIFSVDSSSGKLTACPAAQTGAGDGPRHGAWWAPTAGSTQGQMLYSVNELSNSVSAWTVKYSTNGCMSLTKTQTLSVFASGKKPATSNQPTKAAEVRVSGNFLYASVRNDQQFGSQQDSLATYSIDATTGAITFVESTKANAWYPRTFSINKAGTLVAVGGQTSANVAVVARDPSTGKLGALLASLPVGSKGTDGGEDGLSAVVWAE
jgi:6-phosphogluconolactonase (cycloisomerase 2 family)